MAGTADAIQFFAKQESLLTPVRTIFPRCLQLLRHAASLRPCRAWVRVGVFFPLLLVSAWPPAATLLHADERALQWRMKALDIDGPVPYFIAPGLEELGYRPQDTQLAEWALAAWSEASGGVLCFYPAEGSKALLRIYWSPIMEGRYGQMQPIPVEKRRGGEVYVRPHLLDLEKRSQEVADLAAADPLFRDGVVYLTLLHEIGHALGLVHTPEMSDAMYYGGDVLTYFRNYRETLRTRADIRKSPGLSSTDVRRIQRLYPPTIWYKPTPAAKEETKTSNKAEERESRPQETTSGGAR